MFVDDELIFLKIGYALLEHVEELNAWVLNKIWVTVRRIYTFLSGSYLSKDCLYDLIIYYKPDLRSFGQIQGLC